MKPNIIVFLSDDHAQWALPSYGNSQILAPNLDYLADTGVLMQNAFTPTPVCSPARASFWTGLYPSQHGIHDYLAEHDDAIGARNWLEGKPTIAELLQGAGYQTAMCGKWHCGLGEGPISGFDFWYSAWRQTPKYHNSTAKYSNNGKIQEKSGYDSQIITDAALGFLRQKNDQPFFLFVSLATTHNPWINRAERWVSRYRKANFCDIPDEPAYPFGEHSNHPVKPSNPKEVAAQYYASVSQIDDSVGRVLDELDALDEREQTIMVYTSDHGLNLGHHQVWGKGNGTKPLNMLEESIRVPLILNGPSLLPSGTLQQELVNHTDLFMTLLDYADALPEDRTRYPAQSFKNLISDTSNGQAWRNIHIGEYGNVRMIRTTTHKLILRYPEGPHLLIDIEKDPRETVNLYHHANYQTMIQDLTKQLESFFKRYEVPKNSGLNVATLTKHNPAEAWR